MKLEDDDKAPPPPLLQENVFVEASRPPYLENLHTEALEGLKMMQQEGTNRTVCAKLVVCLCSTLITVCRSITRACTQ